MSRVWVATEMDYYLPKDIIKDPVISVSSVCHSLLALSLGW